MAKDSIAYHWRRYEEGDEVRIYELVRSVWGGREVVPEWNRWLDGWLWMFSHNPAGVGEIWLAEYEGKLIGQYPIVAADMLIKGKVCKVAQLADTMTLQSFRRLGIASKLGGHALEQLRQKNLGLAFGFPTLEAVPVHKRAGWLDVCTCQSVIKPLNYRRLVECFITGHRAGALPLSSTLATLDKVISRNRKLVRQTAIQIEKITRFDRRFDYFWQNLSGDYEIILVRDSTYLNWRYIENPNSEYEVYAAVRDKDICGYVVVESYKKRNCLIWRVVDIIAADDQVEVIGELIDIVVSIARVNGADAVASRVVGGRYLDLYTEHGFYRMPRKDGHFIAFSTSDEVTEEYLSASDRWFIQLGDLPMVY